MGLSRLIKRGYFYRESLSFLFAAYRQSVAALSGKSITVE